MIELNGDKFLVTGGAGFIGSHICEEIVRQGKELICLDHEFRKENLEWWNPKLCTFVKRDVAPAPNTLKQFWKQFDGVDVVFHNAASKCTVCRNRPFKDLRVNARGTLMVAEAARIAGAKLIYASTGSVFKEGSVLFGPCSYYGVSKLAGEMYLNAIKEYDPNFRYVILRYFHVYGPRQNDSDKGGVIPIFIRQALNGGPITVFGDGSQIRHFTHVKDVVRANFAAAKNDEVHGRTFNIAHPTKTTITELAVAIQALVNPKAAIEFHSRRQGDIHHFGPTIGAAPRDLGIMLETGFERGLKETIDWYTNREYATHFWNKASEMVRELSKAM